MAEFTRALRTERRSIDDDAMPAQSGPVPTLHEPGVPWMPNEPDAQHTTRLKELQISAETAVPAHRGVPGEAERRGSTTPGSR